MCGNSGACCAIEDTLEINSEKPNYEFLDSIMRIDTQNYGHNFDVTEAAKKVPRNKLVKI